MRQLWLNGTRMDSIPLLRQYFTHSEQHLRPFLCEQLLEQCTSGALTDWLSRQPELHAVVTQMEALGTIPLTELYDTLTRGNRPAASQLAFLCDVPESWFLTISEGSPKTELTSSQAISEKKAFLMTFDWWEEMAPRLETVSDWANVVTNRNEFFSLLRKHRERQAAVSTNSGSGASISSSPETIYLCNTGESFLWDLREGDRNLRFVGCGQPVLWLDPRRFIPKVDLNQQNFWLEGLKFRYSTSTTVIGDDVRLKHVTDSR